MNEIKVRNISLIVISFEAIIAFGLFGFMVLGTYLPLISIQGNNLPLGVVMFLLIFLLIGIFIILSVFSKFVFYIFTVVEVAFIIYIIFVSSFNIICILFSIAIIAPQIFYYVAKKSG